MKVVVSCAAIVPIGMDFWASLRSPDLLEPAIIPTENRLYYTMFMIEIKRLYYQYLKADRKQIILYYVYDRI